MKAVILAGGLGSRLGDITAEMPKPMLPIGEKPLLGHQLELLKKYGINEVIILTNYLADVIDNYLRGKNFGIEISCFREDKPLGTAGGLKEIEHRLKSGFLTIYGDVMVNMDLGRFLKFHKDKQSDVTLVIHPNQHPQDSDLVEIGKDRRITALHKYPHAEGKYYGNLVNSGIYAAGGSLFAQIKRGVKQDFFKDILPEFIAKVKICGYTTSEYLKDIGTAQRLSEVRRDFESGKIRRFNIENKRKAVFLDRDGTINEEAGYLYKQEDLRLILRAGEAVKKINDSEYLAVVVTNQPAAARNLCTETQLDGINKKLETLLGAQEAKLDAVYCCPHHPDKGFAGENAELKIDCECRKPKTGMIMKAAGDFNIDLSGSFIVGDSWRDMLCGKNAGLTTVAVRTGNGAKDIPEPPDYFFDDIKEAVDFIVNEPCRGLFADTEAGFRACGKRPFVIAIGGNARSGKSTAAAYLAKQFAGRGQKVLRVALDNWLVPESERKRGGNVFERFRMKEMEEDLTMFFNGVRIELKRYNPLLRGHDSGAAVYSIKTEDVIILEGVPALSAGGIRKFADLKIYCDISAGLLRRRVMRYYLWKGMGRAEAGNLYKSRIKDEYELIKKDKIHADIVETAK